MFVVEVVSVANNNVRSEYYGPFNRRAEAVAYQKRLQRDHLAIHVIQVRKPLPIQ